MDFAACGLILLGALAGGFVSGLAGFGTALMALGIWLYVLPPSLAVPLVLICSVIAQSATLPSMWRSFNFTLVWPFIIGGLIGVPIGTVLIHHANPITFKLAFGVFLVVAAAGNWQLLLANAGLVLLVVVGHNAGALLLGWGASRLTGLADADRRALTIEVGMQNSGLALGLILTQFGGQVDMALVAGFWGLWHIVSGLLLVAVWRRNPPRGQEELSCAS